MKRPSSRSHVTFREDRYRSLNHLKKKMVKLVKSFTIWGVCRGSSFLAQILLKNQGLFNESLHLLSSWHGNAASCWTAVQLLDFIDSINGGRLQGSHVSPSKSFKRISCSLSNTSIFWFCSPPMQWHVRQRHADNPPSSRPTQTSSRTPLWKLGRLFLRTIYPPRN